MIRALGPFLPTALPALLFLVWLPLYPFLRPQHARRFFLVFSLVTLVVVGGPLLAGGLVLAIVLGYFLAEHVAQQPPARRRGRLVGTLVLLHAAYWACFWLPLPSAFRPPALDAANGPGVFLFFGGIALTFMRLVSYLIERCRDQPRLPWADYLAFMLYFPQLRHGPLERAHAFAPQIAAARLHWNLRDVGAGLARVALGLGVLAAVAVVWTYGAGRLPAAAAVDLQGLLDEPARLSTPLLALLIHVPALVLYLAESSFAHVQLGVSRAFGVRGTENFRAPPLARDPRDLWHRWNITFSAWLRDYAYIPLGGNRRHRPRNILLTFVYCGLLHGLQWRCLAWGLWAGVTLAGFAWLAPRKPAAENGTPGARPCGRAERLARWGVGLIGRAVLLHTFCLSVIVILDPEHCGWRVLREWFGRVLTWSW